MGNAEEHVNRGMGEWCLRPGSKTYERRNFVDFAITACLKAWNGSATAVLRSSGCSYKLTFTSSSAVPVALAPRCGGGVVTDLIKGFPSVKRGIVHPWEE